MNPLLRKMFNVVLLLCI